VIKFLVITAVAGCIVIDCQDAGCEVMDITDLMCDFIFTSVQSNGNVFDL